MAISQDALPPALPSLSPGHVVREVLALIEHDASVWLYADDVWHVWYPLPQVDPATLPPDRFANLLFDLAHTLCGAISAIQLDPATHEHELRLLAFYLAPYRQHPEFLHLAATLIRVEQEGEVVYPQRPPASPWMWVSARANLKFKPSKKAG